MGDASNVGVLVVGAGPTGLAVATGLRLRGVETTVIDRQPAGANTSRAAVVHARTLEMLEPLGVAERLVRLGLHAPRFSIRDRDRVLVPLHFDTLPTKYPYALMVSQAVTEQVVLERLVELGGEVLRPRAVTGVAQDGGGVTATMDDGIRLRGRYLVGADGMHSTVRELTGIPFPGDHYGESFALADVRMSADLPSDEVILYFAPAGVLVVAPLPDGMHRIVATVETAPEEPGIDFVQALLDARGPRRTPARVREVLWGSRFRVHHRLVDRYREGCVLLAGDAAHVHSPAGGQGMNIGIQDAVTLAEAIGTSLRDGSDDALGAYEATRRPIAHEVIELADRLTRLATMNPGLRPLRNTLLGVLALLPPFRRSLAWRLSGLKYRR